MGWIRVRGPDTVMAHRCLCAALTNPRRLSPLSDACTRLGLPEESGEPEGSILVYHPALRGRCGARSAKPSSWVRSDRQIPEGPPLTALSRREIPQPVTQCVLPSCHRRLHRSTNTRVQADRLVGSLRLSPARRTGSCPSANTAVVLHRSTSFDSHCCHANEY